MAQESAALCQLIDTAIDDCLDKGVKDGMAARVDEICTKLLMEGGAHEATMWIHTVAFHPDNRFQAGLEASDVWALLKTHAPRGWSWAQVHKMARAIEIPMGPEGDAMRQRNIDVAERSAGLLPMVRAEDLQIMAVTKTHTSSTLRVVDRQACPPADDKFFDGLLHEDGRLNREKFIEKYPSYRDPITKGMEWFVVKSGVVKRHPRLPALLQEAGNLDHDTTQKETVLQLVQEAHRKLVAQYTTEQITKDLEHFRPHLQGQTKYLCQFATSWAGGPAGPFLKEIDHFKSTLPVRRDVDPKQLGILASAKMSSMPEWIISCVFALVAAPKNFVQRGSDRSSMFDQGDVDKMIKPQKDGGLKDTLYSNVSRVMWFLVCVFQLCF